MKKIKLLLYQPNPRGAMGAITFNKSNTQTSYQRYAASYTDEAGNPVRCLVFLNANLVRTQAVLASNLQGVEIHVSQEDWDAAMEAQRADRQSDALVFTQFFFEPSEKIEKQLGDMNIRIELEKQKEQDAAANSKRESFLANLEAGLVKSPIRRFQQGQDRTQQNVDQTGKTTGTPSPSTGNRTGEAAEESLAGGNKDSMTEGNIVDANQQTPQSTETANQTTGG